MSSNPADTNPQVDFKTSVCGLTMRNPIVLASGTFGYGSEIAPCFKGMSLEQVGGISLKGIFWEPRRGNNTPRIAETAAGLLNAIGLEGVGTVAMVEEVLPQLQPKPCTLFINVCGTSIDEYQRIIAYLNEKAPEAWDAIELNISCPNLTCGGLEFGVTAEAAAQVTKASVEAAGNHPIFVKLAPMVANLAEIALAVVEAGAQGLSLVNTYPGMAIDLEKRKPVLAKTYGGLSGPAIKPLALRAVHLVHRALVKAGRNDVDIIGMGGITNGRDALEFLLAGAAAVSLGTVNFLRPFAYRDVLAEMEELMCKRYGQSCNARDLTPDGWSGAIIG